MEIFFSFLNCLTIFKKSTWTHSALSSNLWQYLRPAVHSQKIHRITEQFRLEEALRSTQPQPPALGRAAPPPPSSAAYTLTLSTFLLHSHRAGPVPAAASVLGPTQIHSASLLPGPTSASSWTNMQLPHRNQCWHKGAARLQHPPKSPSSKHHGRGAFNFTQEMGLRESN